MDEVTINLWDLIRRILRSWKLILVCMIVGAVLLDGAGYVRKVMQNNQQSAQSEQEETLQAVEDAAQDLSEREREEAETAAEAYRTIYAQYQTDLIYCENSLKMKLNPNCVPTLTAQFYIDNSRQPEIRTSDVVASYETIVTSEDVCQEILSALGWDTNVAYIEELISVNTDTKTNSTSVANSETDTTTNTNVNLNVNTDDTNLLTITIIAEEKADCESIMDIIEQNLQEETGELQATFGNFDLTLLQKKYMEKADDELLAFQTTQYSGLNTLRSSLNTLVNNLPSEQEDYFYSLLDAQKVELVESEAQNEIVTEAETAVAAPNLINWKYILLGLFLGLVAACAWVLLRYILSPNLRVKDDLEEVYHFPLLGTLYDENKKKFMASGAEKTFTPQERMEMICAGIRIAIEKADMKSVYVTGTAGDEKSGQVMEQLKQAFEGEPVQISSGRSVAYDPASLEAMTASDGVVFVERVDASPYLDMQKEAETCQKYDIPVIGAVVIE